MALMERRRGLAGSPPPAIQKTLSKVARALAAATLLVALESFTKEIPSARATVCSL